MLSAKCALFAPLLRGLPNNPVGGGEKGEEDESLRSVPTCLSMNGFCQGERNAAVCHFFTAPGGKTE